MPPKPKTKKMVMTDDHKAALAEGRRQGAAVRAYLDALEQHKPKRGRKRTADSIGKRLATIESELKGATSVDRLQLIQERMDLQNELAGMDAKVDLSKLEAEFVAQAQSYGQRKGISYLAWRELGVSADVLRKAGVGRSAR
jgi:hypothetical protein